MKEITILFITHTPIMGGANQSMLQLIEELRNDYKINPIIIFPKWKIKTWNIEDECKKQSIKYISNKFYWFKSRSNSLIIYCKFFLNIFFYIQILYKIRKIKFDIIHSNGSVIDLGAFISSVKNIKHIWHLREFGDIDFQLYPILGKKYEQWVYQKAEAFIAISNKVKKHFSTKINDKKIHLIYNGISPAKYCKISTHTNPIINICITGVVSEAKNQLEAIKALNLIINKHQYKQLHLHIIGNNNNSYSNKLLKYIETYNLQDFITFTGEINNIPEYLSNMDLGLMLSRNEAFGRVTIEYMFQNIAVIATNTGANNELIENNKTGLIYDFNNIEMLAQLIMKVCKDKNLLCTLSSNGKEYAHKNFTSNKNTKQIYNLYMQLINSK